MALKTVSVSSSATVVHQPSLTEQIKIFNAGPVTAWISNNAAVTTSTGYPLTPNSFIVARNVYNSGTPTTPVVLSAITASGVTTLQVTSGVS